MKILIIMKLGDENLKNHILPLTKLRDIEKIFIVRDSKGPELEKVCYICPNEIFLKIPLFNLIIKTLLALKIIVKENPSFVLGYLFFPHGLLALITGKITGKRVGVSLVAGPVEVYTMGGSPVDDYAFTRPLPCLTFKSKIMVKIIDQCDVLIVGGTFSKKFFEREGIDGKKIFILYKAMNEKFQPIGSKKEYDIIFIGRLTKAKHVETLVKAIAIIKNNHPEVKVAIVGDGSEKQSLEKNVQDLGLGNNIIFTGWKDDPWNWFNKAKISVLTSEREGFAQSIVQSLQCGVPVISTNCGDISDAIRTGYNGILINDHEDADSFAQAIEFFLKNPQVLKDYSDNAIKTVEDIFNIRSAVSVWEQILH